MLIDGEYAAWFRTSHGEGTGIVHLANGKLSGCDSFFSYSGSYEVDDDRFTATVTTRRYADGPTTVFGVDEVELKVTGTINGTIACCSGTSEQAPDVRFEATLLLSQEPPAASELERPMPGKVAKLPKLTGEGHRGRRPFVSGR